MTIQTKQGSGNSSEDNGNDAPDNQVVTEEQTVTIHPVGERVPPHLCSRPVPPRSQKDKDVLFEDIQSHGLINPGTMFEGMLLDGNERNEACIRAGIPFRTVEYQDDSPEIFILTTHCQNRSLKGYHRAVLAAKTANLSLGSNQHTGSGSAKLQTLISVEEAAGIVGVSPRYVESAKTVISYSDKLAEAVCEGKVPLSLAEEVAKRIKPPEKAERLLEKDNPKKALTELLASVFPNDSGSLKPKTSNVKKHIRKLVEFFEKQPELLTENVLDCLSHELTEFIKNSERRDLAEELRDALSGVVFWTYSLFDNEESEMLDDGDMDAEDAKPDECDDADILF